MKNLYRLFATILITLSISCGGDESPTPALEPTPDYSQMVPKVKGHLTTLQVALSNRDWQKVIDLTGNPSDLSVSAYPLTSDIENKSKLTVVLSNIKEILPSKVNSGRIIFTGDYKETEEEPGSSHVVRSTKFTATFNCIGDKNIKEDWKLNIRFNQ